MAATLPPPRLLPSGDSAITVEFSRNIDDAANRRVLALDRAMAAEPIAGVTETVPTYRSLLVHYDPEQINYDKLGEKVLALAQRPIPATTKSRRWRIPVVYGGEHGIDHGNTTLRHGFDRGAGRDRRRPGLRGREIFAGRHEAQREGRSDQPRLPGPQRLGAAHPDVSQALLEQHGGDGGGGHAGQGCEGFGGQGHLGCRLRRDG
jgi:hypothetical protein